VHATIALQEPARLLQHSFYSIAHETTSLEVYRLYFRSSCDASLPQVPVLGATVESNASMSKLRWNDRDKLQTTDDLDSSVTLHCITSVRLHVSCHRTIIRLRSVCPSVHRIGMKMEKVRWDVNRDGVIARVGLGYEVNGKRRRKRHAFGGLRAYTIITLHYIKNIFSALS